MYSKYFISVILVLLLVQSSFSQNIRIDGTIHDKQTHEPVGIVNIYVQHKNIGSISNMQGEYFINIPEKFKNDTLCFSSMGYHTDKICIADIKQNEYNAQISQQTIKLNDVIISVKKTDVIAIIEKAKENLTQNYSVSYFLVDCYYRHFIKLNKKFTFAREMAFTACDRLKEGNLSANISLKGIRYNVDKSEIKNNFVFANMYWNLKLLLSEYIKSGEENHSAKLDTFYYNDNEKIYVISVTDEYFNESNINFECLYKPQEELIISSQCKPLKNDDKPFYCAKFYINASNFAVIKYECTSYKTKGFNMWGTNTKTGKTKSREQRLYESICFRKLDKLYYPVHIKGYNKIVSFSEKLQQTSITENYYDIVVNRIEPNYDYKKNKDNFSDYYRVVDDYSMNRTKIKEDPEFWKNYNYLKDDNLRKTVIKALSNTINKEH